eukprot:1155748-Pelagomonas_calceolata.AAC.5
MYEYTWKSAAPPRCIGHLSSCCLQPAAEGKALWQPAAAGGALLQPAAAALDCFGTHRFITRLLIA